MPIRESLEDYRNRLLAQLNTGKVPDLMDQSVLKLSTGAAKGCLADLTDVYTLYQDMMFASAKQPGKVGDRKKKNICRSMGVFMYQVGICDDGKNTCVEVEDMLLQYAKEKSIQIDTNIWYTGEGLRDYLAAGNCLDILFLDIELLQMTGIEVGNYIRSQLDNIQMQIIYISGKSSYAQQLFKTQPLDFLVKPLSQSQINSVMDVAVKVIQRKNRRLEFQKGKDYFYIPMGDIIYLSSEGRKIKVVTASQTFDFYGKLKEVQKELPTNFLAIHKSYIVNREYVFRYTYEQVELVNGTVLTISAVHRKDVRKQLLREE